MKSEFTYNLANFNKSYTNLKLWVTRSVNNRQLNLVGRYKYYECSQSGKKSNKTFPCIPFCKIDNKTFSDVLKLIAAIMVVSAALYLPFIFKNTGQPAYIVTRVKECEIRIYQAITIGTAMQSLIEIFLVQWVSIRFCQAVQ